MSDLGDLSNFLKEGSGSGVVNLDWLDVDEKAYQETALLPKQNLDIAPDLVALWRHRDEPSSRFVPNTGAPKTMGDLSEIHGRLRGNPEDLLVRTARLAIMQTTDPRAIRGILASRFDRTSLTISKTALATVFAERGLLGRLYIDAADFPECNTRPRASEFVRRYAAEAPYVLAKEACGDCCHRHTLPSGTNHCSVFHKEIQVEIPYTNELASNIERQQQALGKAVQASTEAPKERIRKAFLAGAAGAPPAFTGRPQVAPDPVKASPQEVLIAASNLTKKRDAKVAKDLLEAKAKPIVALIRRELLKGRSESDLIHALRLAFDVGDLKATRSEWLPLFKEAGLYGAVYTTQDSFEDCREGADFLSKHGSKVRGIVAGSKCGSCIFNQISRCMVYGRKLVASAEELYTQETVDAVIDEERIAGRLPQGANKVPWGDTPVAALKAIHKAASIPVTAGDSLRVTVEKAFRGAGVQNKTSEITKREILRTASRYMNEGLYGSDLLGLLKGKFDPRDLVAAANDLKKVIAEQGLQGIYYVDPTIYEDYGFGCKEAARLHRSRTAVKYLKIGDKCGSCVHHTRPGFCSVVNKQLVVEPPYIDKVAEQRAILSSGASMEVSYESLMNNGLTMMQEYELQHGSSNVDLNPEAPVIQASVEFGIQEFKL